MKIRICCFCFKNEYFLQFQKLFLIEINFLLKQSVVQQVQFVDDEKDDCDETKDNCLFLDKSLTMNDIAEKIINEEKKIIQKVSDTFDSTKEWTLSHFNHLPEWLQDNEYLINGHRPQLNSFSACFRSVFKKHTGLFIFISIYFQIKKD